MKFYVYLLRDPRPGKDLQPIYVGKGKGGRARKHWRRAEEHPNPVLRRVFDKIRQDGLEPQLEIIGHFDVEADAFQLEIELIAKYGRRDLQRGALCNLTNGGEGTSGCLVTGEVLRRLHLNPEYSEAHAERMRKLNADPEFAKANAERGREMMRRLNANPEFLKAQAERMRKRNVDPEFSKVRNERVRKSLQWNDPEFRAQRCAAMATASAKRRAAKTDDLSPQYTGAGP